MSTERRVRYADSDGLQIAYEVIGDGPLDIVTMFDTGTNLDLMHEEPGVERFLRRFGDYGRQIAIDPRGVGLSDPVDQMPTLEAWVGDVRAVLAAAGSERAALVGHGNGAQLCLLYAAMHPNSTTAVVTVNGYARLRQAPDYPPGWPEDVERVILAQIETTWGTGEATARINPTIAQTARGRDFLAKLERASATPRRAVLRQRLALELDIRDVLPSVGAPTLVIQSLGNRFVRPGNGRYLAEHIDGASLLEIASDDHAPFHLQDQELIVEPIERFLTGTTRRAPTDRALMTIAFTDIVDSTARAAELGDQRWRGLLELHETIARREVEAARGRLIKFTGDGLMATFDGPARAVECMRSLTAALLPVGLPIRSGVHAGEVEVLGDDIGGIAVHVAARISALAPAGRTYVSSTVRDLVAGSGLVFEDLGTQVLKGVPEPWRVFAVADPT